MKVIKHFPYRTGMVRGLQVPRDLMKPLEESLFKEIGKPVNNHTCFAIKGEYGTTGAVMFTDLVCIIGHYVEEGEW